MSKEFVTAVAKRFGKAFLAGGLAQVSVVLASGHSLSSLGDAKTLGGILLSAFVAGGVLGLQKALAWQE